MTEEALKNYIRENFPKENETCERKNFQSLKHNFSAHEGEDIISYISALANMEGGHLVIGVHDGSLDIIGIQEFGGITAQNIKLRVTQKCPGVDSDNLYINELITTDSQKTVWVIQVPKHLP